jgi:hypothetical protein
MVELAGVVFLLGEVASFGGSVLPNFFHHLATMGIVALSLRRITLLHSLMPRNDIMILATLAIITFACGYLKALDVIPTLRITPKG